MPHLRFRALPEAAVQKLSSELPRELSVLLQTPMDNFTVERISTQFFKDGQPVEGDPMIEVLWFDRGQFLKDKCAQIITDLVRAQVSGVDIAVVFTVIPKESYFENGKHFGEGEN